MNKYQNKYFKEARLIYMSERAPQGAESGEKAPLRPKVLKKMAEYKARKTLYNDWGKTTLETLKEQEGRLKERNFNTEGVFDPKDAYKMLDKLAKKMKKAWEKEQAEGVEAVDGVIDVGVFNVPFTIDEPPCKPLSKKEQAYLSANGKKMPESQYTEYQNLIMEKMLSMQGVSGFNMAKNSADKAYEDLKDKAGEYKSHYEDTDSTLSA